VESKCLELLEKLEYAAMHYLRFISCAAGVLVALLFVANAYLPQPDAVQPGRGFDHSIIRIASTQKLPERLVGDTTMRAPVPPAPITTAAAASPGPDHQREAFAQMSAAESAHADQAVTHETKPVQRKPARHLASRTTSNHREHLARNGAVQPQPGQPQVFAGIFSPFGIR